jgi:hypothetical protein
MTGARRGMAIGKPVPLACAGMPKDALKSIA